MPRSLPQIQFNNEKKKGSKNTGGSSVGKRQRGPRRWPICSQPTPHPPGPALLHRELHFLGFLATCLPGRWGPWKALAEVWCGGVGEKPGVLLPLAASPLEAATPPLPRWQTPPSTSRAPATQLLLGFSPGHTDRASGRWQPHFLRPRSGSSFRRC